MSKPNLPTATKSFEKLTDRERLLWKELNEIKESGNSTDGKPEGDSNGDQFCAMTAEYLRLNKAIEALESEKKTIRDFLYGRLITRSLGVVNCDTGTVSLRASQKEVQDTKYLKEIAPEAFATVPDQLKLYVTEAK